MTSWTTAARVLVPFGLGYFLSFLYRTVNAVIGPDLVASLGLQPADLGLLTSAYFISFAAFQIPLGVLLDRYGPRRVDAALLVVAAGGAAVFALAASTGTLTLGRALVGLGVSACLMAPMKANVQWWPPERLPLANGIILAMGGLGALVATAPAHAALAYTDWRGLYLGLAGVTLVIAAALLLVAPEAPSGRSQEAWGSAFLGALGVFREPVFWLFAPVSGLVQGTFLSYHGLWAASWLRDVDGLDRGAVAGVLASATVGIIVGTFSTGFLADRLARRGVPTAAVGIAAVAGFILMEAALVARLPGPPSLYWAGMAFCGMGAALFYAALTQMFGRALGGRVNTALNLAVFVVAFLLQWLVGGVLTALVQHLGLSPADAHRAILAGLAVLQAIVLARLVASGRLAPPPDREA